MRFTKHLPIDPLTIYRADEAAERLKICRRSLVEEVNAGRGPRRANMGSLRVYRFLGQDLLDWLRAEPTKSEAA
jgi:Helix-turn-helix domain